MSSNIPDYPFDPTGTAASNLIPGEIKALSPPNYSDFYFIVPRYAPFFEDGLRIVLMGQNGRPLVKGVDYTLSHKFQEASLGLGKNVYGSITIYDKTLAGAVSIDYQTVGGEWIQPEATIIELLSNALTDPRITTWEQVINPPGRFPVIDHSHDVDDMTGAQELEAALQAIAEAVGRTGEGAIDEHVQDMDNPHNTTKTHVGLGSVQNYGIATSDQAVTGTSNALYMTPLRVREAINALAADTLNAHVSDQNNPHGTNKTHVGLGEVQNYGVATIQEAEAGTVNDKYMTPALVRLAIQQQNASMIAHMASTLNPHNTTKAQVGLGSVQNYGVAGVLDARAGLSNELYMTPAMTREAILALGAITVDNHVSNQNNPHNTNKGHVGLGDVQNYGVASTAEAEAGTVDDKYMTPALVRAAVEAGVGAALDDHLNDIGNPHQTTKAQVGLSNVQNYGVATQAEATAGVSEVKYMTPALVRAAIAAFSDSSGQNALIADHVADRENPHDTTKAHVGLSEVQNYGVATQLEAEQGVADNKYMTPRRVAEAVGALVDLGPYQAHLNDTNNPHQTTAADVGAYSTNQVDQMIDGLLGATQTATDSERLGGLTLTEVLSTLEGGEVVHAADTTGDISYTRLMAYGVSLTELASAQNVVVRVVGGQPAAEAVAPEYVITVPALTAVDIQIQQVSGNPTDVRFATEAVTVDGVLTRYVYLVGAPYRNGFTVLPLKNHAGSNFDIVPNQNTLNNVYGTRDVGFNVDSAARMSAPGELIFGQAIGQHRQDPSGLFSLQVNVFGPNVDDQVARDHAVGWLDEYLDWAPYSLNDIVLGRKAPNDAWRANYVTGYGVCTTAGTIPAVLLGRNYSTDYTFEVELAGGENGGMLAVCAAEVTRSGKSLGIYVGRTPGAVVEASNGRYGLLTVGINLGQLDERILVAINGDGLQWGDGVWADTRDFDADPIVDGDWDNAGPVRVKVTRAGTTLTIETTNHGATSYIEDAKVVLDLSEPALNVFQGATRVGLAVTSTSTSGQFKALAFPGSKVPYLKPNAEGDTVLNAFNGDAWTSVLAHTSANFRPGRLLHSPVNGTIHRWRRDGSVKYLHIEAATGNDYVVFTP